MKRLAILSLLLAVGGCASLEIAERLLPVAMGVAPAPPLTLAWRRDVDGSFGPTPAVAVGTFLAVSTRRGDVTVVERATGRTVGQQRFGDSVEGAAALGDDGRTLFVPVAGGGPGVVAYDVRDGRTRWRWPASGASRDDRRLAAVTGGVVRMGATVAMATTAGVAVGLDAATGAERWRHALADTTAQIHAAPVALDDATVLVADTRGLLTALDAATGAVRWSATAGAPVYDTPSADGHLVVATTTRGGLVALDAATGRVRWTAAVGERVRLSAPTISSGLVVVGGSDGAVRAFDAATGAPRWTWNGDGAVTARPLVSGGFVYAGTQRKRLVALDAATGTERWSTALDGRVRGAPLAADGTLYVFAEPRHVYAFRPVAPAPR